ncbi:MAG: hypothetical protein JWQ14_2981 [Adhaeribacter sp.]|nr:hypothetical protein [Adhaeribacter sp.]
MQLGHIYFKSIGWPRQSSGKALAINYLTHRQKINHCC